MTGQDAVNVAKAFGERAGITGDRADPGRRRCARRCGIVDARHHRQADRADRGRRADRGARRRFMPSASPGAFSAWAMSSAWSRRRPRRSTRRRPKSSPPSWKRGGSTSTISPLSCVRSGGWAGWAVCSRLLPGIGKLKKQLGEANIDEGIIKRQEAIISSMTKSERRNPKLLNGSRRRRIASGSGTTVPEINRLLKQYQDMADITKKMKKLGQQGSDASRSRRAAARRISALAEGNGMSLKIRLARGGAKKRPYLQHRRRGLAQPARRPLYREARNLQPDARALACRSSDPQNRADPALARGRRPADRSRRPFSRRGGPGRKARRSATTRSSRGRRRAPRSG